MIIAPAPQEKLESPRFSLRSLFIFVAIASLPLAAVGYIYRELTTEWAEIARLDELDQKTMVTIVQEVDAICLMLGRTPKDQVELESLLGKPMPEVHERTHPISIRYDRTSDSTYQLHYWTLSGPGDYHVYDSSKPNAGWEPFYD